ncbi:crystallin J1B-like [Acanthaster planci]|uniref:Crystallin J1B-like n=1 Tax=Acanthaster planci TaxID=133434 RepID=A0A8B7XZ21_ACAPL|nr:crystallin J1B-like [Acanthaster planci]
MSSAADRSSRGLAAIVGCLVSDAAAQPLHWIYNLDKLDSIVGSNTDSLEFWEPSQNPYYRIETGRGTAYADHTIALMESLVACEGYDKADFGDHLQAMFGPGTDYDNDLNKTFVLKSGVQSGYPINGPWRPKAIKDFLANRAEGKERTGSDHMHDMHAVVGVVPMVALYAGRSDMLEKVEESIAVVTEVEEAIVVGLAAARVLEQFILNPDMDGDAALTAVMTDLASPSRNNPTDLDRAVIGQLKKVMDKKACEHREAAQKYFLNNLPGAFQSALHCLVNHSELAPAVRTTMMAGGCNASRSGFIGACLGARNGLQGIPETWKSKTLAYPRILELSRKLVAIQPTD